MGYAMVLWRAVTYLPPVWVLVLQSMLFWSVQPAFGHSDAIVQCKGNIKYSKAEKIGLDAIIEGTGLYAEHYDTNGDGKWDVIALSHTDLGTKGHRTNPVFWLVDSDYDGIPDALYIDKQGLGNCKDIVLYEDLNAPTMNIQTLDEIDRGRTL